MPTPQARRRRAIIEVVAVSAVLVATQWWNDDQRDNAIRREQNTRVDEACHIRNTGNELGRRNLDAVLVGASAGSERSSTYIDEQIRPLLNGPAEMDRDCNGDGWLTVDEYEDPTTAPEGLPILVDAADAGVD